MKSDVDDRINVFLPAFVYVIRRHRGRGDLFDGVCVYSSFEMCVTFV